MYRSQQKVLSTITCHCSQSKNVDNTVTPFLALAILNNVRYTLTTKASVYSRKIIVCCRCVSTSGRVLKVRVFRRALNQQHIFFYVYHCLEILGK